jgi:hypothetical protein
MGPRHRPRPNRARPRQSRPARRWREDLTARWPATGVREQPGEDDHRHPKTGTVLARGAACTRWMAASGLFFPAHGRPGGLGRGVSAVPMSADGGEPQGLGYTRTRQDRYEVGRRRPERSSATEGDRQTSTASWVWVTWSSSPEPSG